ncbi:MAG: DUF1667 domain-containing protein [Oscillospiraceae bacterium]|jgi:CxxC motif-containing protein|nr:DUF1667 domain-containing protein [Oscillospiraceae bacterium]
MTKEIICVACPVGCGMQAEYAEGGSIISLTGNSCNRGLAYAQAELTNPTRMFHSTMRVEGGPLVSVKSAAPVPKARLMDCARATFAVRVRGPVAIGDTLLPNVCGTGVDLIATDRTI